MSNSSLEDFFVQIMVKMDEDGLRKAEQKAGRTQERITAKADAEGQQRLDREKFRQALLASGNDLAKVKMVETEKRTSDAVTKVAKEGADRQTKIDTEFRKKAAERRAADFKDLSKHAVQFEALALKVAGIAAGVGGVLSASGFVRDVVGTASAYSRLSMEAQRTNSTPQQIKSVLYGLTQLGVDQGDADSSFQGFSRYLQQNPGLRSILAKAGIDVSGSPSQIFAQLGHYFSTLRPNVALAAAGRMGISQDVELSLQNPAYAGKVAEGYQKFGAANQASEDGRKMTAAYDRLATDLEAIKDRMEAGFFGPLTKLMDGLSDAVERSPQAFDKMVKGLTALSVSLGALAALPLPPWVKALLMAGDANAILAKPYVEQHGIGSIDPATAQPFEENPLGAFAPKPGQETWLQRKWRTRPRWMGGEGAGGARSRLGRRLGMDGGGINTGGSSAGNLTKLINEEAVRAGIDPRIMQGIRAGESGHGPVYDRKDDAVESSWGPFQLNRRRGLGVQFEKETGLDVRDPSTIPAQVRWVANFIAHGGSLSNWMGYRGPRDADPRWGDSGYVPTPQSPNTPTQKSGEHFDQTPESAAARNASMVARWKAQQANPFGTFDPNAFRTSPLMGISPTRLQSSIDNSTRTGPTFTQNNTINGVSDPRAVDQTLKIQARRGGQDMLRLTQGSTQ